MLQNFRFALRVLAKSPGFSLIAILTLALGIGANTAIFTVANALLLRPLPYADPDRLMVLSGATFDAAGGWGRLSLPFFEVIRDHNRSYSNVAACIYEWFSLTGHGDPEQISAARATWRFFDTLGVHPIVGRTFSEEEDRAGGKAVILVSSKLAARLFGDAAKALGQNLTLDGRDYSVIGVLPPSFVFGLFGGERDIWAPRVSEMNAVTPARVALGGAYFNLIGRLRPGVSIQQAAAELEVLYRQYQSARPSNFDATRNLHMRVATLQSELVTNVRPTLLVLCAAVGLVLLIACANVANLLLSRAVGRRQEFSIRTALGASRGTLIGQLLTESLLLAAVSGALGVAIGYAGTRILPLLHYDYEGLPMGQISMDFRILAFAILISLASGMLFGLAPALQISRTDVNTGLREESRGSFGNRGRNRARSALVVAQVALSMVLLIASGLLIRSFLRLRNASPGFDPSNLLTMQINLPPARYADAARSIAFYRDVIQNVENLPGVDGVAVSTAIPTNATHSTPVLFEGQPAVVLGQRPIVDIQQINADYARVMRIPLLGGRMFDEHDDVRAPKVALVNQTAVRRFWPNENPIGKRVWIGTMKDSFEVAGVIGNTKNNGPAAATEPEVFMPLAQMVSPYVSLTVRATGDPHGLVSAVRAGIASADPDQPVTGVQTMEEFMETQSSQTRFTMALLGVFAGVALILAVVGIYGVIAYSVAQRTQELGIRIALGAGRRDILRLVISGGLGLTLGGIAIGLAASIAATRLMASLLFETSATDPIAFLASSALFVGVALTASYIPARRATRIDPTRALRAE
ncbi:MAG TPA: ABC transporter permease [Bryobacteraceae bacterium]|nr:ABC transporter permease [Bryobacteraceae bacterium]